MSRLLKVYRHFNYVWPEGVPVPTPKTVMQPIGPDSLKAAETLRNASVARTFERFLTDGRFGVYAIVDGVAVGHAWVTSPVGRSQVANTYAKLTPGESLIHYCFVSPEHRGRGLYGQMLHETTSWALEHGARTVRVDTSSDNSASQRGIEKAGFQESAPTVSVVIGRHLLLTRVSERSQFKKKD